MHHYCKAGERWTMMITIRLFWIQLHMEFFNANGCTIIAKIKRDKRLMIQYVSSGYNYSWISSQRMDALLLQCWREMNDWWLQYGSSGCNYSWISSLQMDTPSLQRWREINDWWYNTSVLDTIIHGILHYKWMHHYCKAGKDETIDDYNTVVPDTIRYGILHFEWMHHYCKDEER